LLLAIANVVLYNKNTRMTMLRNSKENDILRRISNYVTRCDEMHDEVLSPESVSTGNAEEEGRENQDFINAMLMIVPYLHTHTQNQVSMRKLSELTGLEVSKLFELLSTNFYQNPRQMVAKLRIQEAAELLRTTRKPIEQIADELKFISPNYFIASFYHQYRQTPLDYRKSKAL
jgi:AraC-like DNA-binding protein